MTVVAAPALSNSTLADIVLIAVAVLVLVGLACVALHRLRLQQRRPDAADASMTRPVLAVLLVGTLLILAAASLTFADAQARNLLIGGVVSLGSAAAAFYFASSNAAEARRDRRAAWRYGTARCHGVAGLADHGRELRITGAAQHGRRREHGPS
jgi:hypothetical protein